MMKPLKAVVYLLSLLVAAVSSLLPSKCRQNAFPSGLNNQFLRLRSAGYLNRSTQSCSIANTCLFQKMITADPETDQLVGKILRTAFRQYDKQHSIPSGANYTTKKDAPPNGIKVLKAGIQGDYNRYRTLALKSTPDRAVCLWTTDVLPLLHANHYPVEVGDLGENLSVEGVPFDFFEIGQQYQFVNNNDESVIIEITERAEPCANLCKLPYINEESLQPKERIQKCVELIEVLNQADGLRGWYAKVIQEGGIRPGDKVTFVEEQYQD